MSVLGDVSTESTGVVCRCRGRYRHTHLRSSIRPGCFMLHFFPSFFQFLSQCHPPPPPKMKVFSSSFLCRFVIFACFRQAHLPAGVPRLVVSCQSSRGTLAPVITAARDICQVRSIIRDVVGGEAARAEESGKGGGHDSARHNH